MTYTVYIIQKVVISYSGSSCIKSSYAQCIFLDSQLSSSYNNTNYLQDYRPTKKKDKDSQKNKFANTPPTDILSKKPQSSIYQANKKNQNNQEGFQYYGGQRQD